MAEQTLLSYFIPNCQRKPNAAFELGLLAVTECRRHVISHLHPVLQAWEEEFGQMDIWKINDKVENRFRVTQMFFRSSSNERNVYVDISAHAHESEGTLIFYIFKFIYLFKILNI